jgi:DNA end-binding protein Ku
MPRAIWTGAISFGLVTVPVKVYSAVNRKSVRFHQLSGRTGVRVAQKRIDPQSGDEVPYEEIVKGYEISPERYVVIEPAELDTLEPAKTRTIDLEDFVELSQIDPIFYEHPYYLVPGPGGAKPYRLLLEAMRETSKVAIARVVMRSKEHLVAIRPVDDVLEMDTMLFADEVLPPERLDELPDPSEVTTTKRERDIAGQLVGSLAGDFRPEKYRDSYREKVLALIERKAQGKEIAVQPPAEEIDTAVPDLMGALKASLDAVRAREGNNTGEPPKAARKAPRAKAPAAEARAAKPAGAGKAPAGKRAAAKKPAAKSGASRAQKP